MEHKSITKRLVSILVLNSSAAIIFILLTQSAFGFEYEQLEREDFVLAAPQGFGDRGNSWAWGMAYFNGKLYVSTNRHWRCVEIASIHNAFSIVPYPPDDPDIDCEADPDDLDLQAEIWSWDPISDIWTRVYQSPLSVEIPDSPGKFVARDIALRGMFIYTEPDGTEALYVSGMSTDALHEGVPPARILRSVDGINFNAVPMEPGTFLWDIGTASYRGMASHDGRLFAVAGSIRGPGTLIESTEPWLGNNTFKQSVPTDWKVLEIASFNDYLYISISDREGYKIVKTDASGDLPYNFVTIVEKGGYKKRIPNREMLSMYVYNEMLYCGGSGMKSYFGAEMIRIHPDDSWDLVVGVPRDTPVGRKEPISGMRAGFNWPLNAHIWRFEEYDGRLYVTTFDISTIWKDQELMDNFLEKFMGFDFFVSSDGVHFDRIDHDGFEDMFNFGGRTMAATPYGLFIGTANYYYGLQIWRGTPAELK
ncbi:MAG: hypothetical protein PVI60_04490 [Desulfobacteraceae bacterium]|jgi:hypothetical protein